MRVWEVEGVVPDQVRVRVSESIQVEVGVISQHNCWREVSMTLLLFG